MSLSGAYCLVTGIFARQMQQDLSLTAINDGNQRRDFTYVGDEVDATLFAAKHKQKLNGEVFNIGNGKISLLMMLQICLVVLKSMVKKELNHSKH